jgi:hypothetical protein
LLDHTYSYWGRIDAIGASKTIRESEAHVELAYQECEEENVTLVRAVAPP